ncbi:nucleotidyltransferase domain-containing protein [Bradyrhizobium japonicum]|uniref:nucleotidyltransferase domain-containing protein n=1 Tax=Bradyrhizobium japonicum TaxID=375 RepID=UPI0006767A6C
MGRAEGVPEEGLAHLLGSCKSLAGFESYMFGSTLNGVGRDIDILVVGPDGEPLSKLKSELGVAAESLPLHLLYMLPSEANHTRFVAREKCVPLAYLAGYSESRV